MQTVEEWKLIPGYGGHYDASSLGRVRVKDRIIRKPHSRTGGMVDYFYPGRVLTLNNGKRGYWHAHIGIAGKRISLAAHRAVLFAFVGEPKEGEEACHCNGDKSDNRVENLRWDSHYENNQDRKRHGTYPRGESHPMSKFSQVLIEQIKTGAVAQKDSGVSVTHYYRIKRGDGLLEKAA